MLTPPDGGGPLKGQKLVIVLRLQLAADLADAGVRRCCAMGSRLPGLCRVPTGPCTQPCARPSSLSALCRSREGPRVSRQTRDYRSLRSMADRLGAAGARGATAPSGGGGHANGAVIRQLVEA